MVAERLLQNWRAAKALPGARLQITSGVPAPIV